MTVHPEQNTASEELKHPKYGPGARTICRILLTVLSDFKVVGHYPEPPFIGTGNHLSYFDALAAAASTRHLTILPMAASKYRQSRMAWMFNLFAPIWIDQDSPDRKALTNALKYLKMGYPVAIAPEGRRSKVGHLLPGQEGAAFLVTRANLPIVPVAIYGTEKILKHPRPKVRWVIGKPYRLPEGRAKGDQLAEYTERIMCGIAALLPAEYHGHYAGNPLIQEMASLVL